MPPKGAPASSSSAAAAASSSSSASSPAKHDEGTCQRHFRDTSKKCPSVRDDADVSELILSDVCLDVSCSHVRSNRSRSCVERVLQQQRRRLSKYFSSVCRK